MIAIDDLGGSFFDIKAYIHLTSVDQLKNILSRANNIKNMCIVTIQHYTALSICDSLWQHISTTLKF